jgi:hypothetical protein
MITSWPVAWAQRRPLAARSNKRQFPFTVMVSPSKTGPSRRGRTAEILAHRGPEMKRIRLTEEQVVKIVKAIGGGLPIKDAVRQFGGESRDDIS